MSSGSVPPIRFPVLFKASDAKKSAQNYIRRDAYELNLGLLVEAVSIDVKNAAALGKKSIRYKLPDYCIGGSLYNMEEMRKLLMKYLVEKGGYDVEMVGVDAMYIQWERSHSTQILTSTPVFKPSKPYVLDEKPKKKITKIESKEKKTIQL